MKTASIFIGYRTICVLFMGQLVGCAATVAFLPFWPRQSQALDSLARYTGADCRIFIDSAYAQQVCDKYAARLQDVISSTTMIEEQAIAVVDDMSNEKRLCYQVGA